MAVEVTTMADVMAAFQSYAFTLVDKCTELPDMRKSLSRSASVLDLSTKFDMLSSAAVVIRSE